MTFSMYRRSDCGEANDTCFALAAPGGATLPLRALTQSEAEYLAGTLNTLLDDGVV